MPLLTDAKWYLCVVLICSTKLLGWPKGHTRFPWIYSGKTHTPTLANDVFEEVLPLSMCFRGETKRPIEIPFPQFCLAFKFFFVTYLKAFFHVRYHLQSCRIVNCSAWAPIFNLFLWHLATKQQDCFKAYSGSEGKLSLWSIPLPHWKLEWHAPVQTPRRCFSLLPPSSSSSRQIPNCAKEGVEGADIPKWGDCKERGWRWEPEHQEMRRWACFSKLSPIRWGTMLCVSHACFSCMKGRLDLEIWDPWNQDQAVLL